MLALLASAVACDRGRETGRDAAATFRGVVLSPPLKKPDVTLTDTEGQPYNLRLKTAGMVVLLFFGYTHCPDVCPLHAANIAAVLRQMPFDERAKIQFLFVTTDPARDTPQRLKEWLSNFDPSFVGLTAPSADVAQLEASLGVAPSRKETPATGDSASYLVGHGAQVIAFGLDQFAHTEYPFGIRQEDWAWDLPRLARGEVPSAPPPANNTATAGTGSVAGTTLAPGEPAFQIALAVMAQPVSASEASVYLVVRNGAGADTLTSVWSPEATGAAIHHTQADGGSMRMVASGAVPVAAGATLEFLPGGTHVMLTGLRHLPAAGE